MTEKLLTTRDVSELLGVSLWYVADRIKDGSLEVVKLGRLTRITPAALDSFIAANSAKRKRAA